MSDELRDEVAGALAEALGWDWAVVVVPSVATVCGELADALLPLIREREAAAWDAGRQALAEQMGDVSDLANPFRDALDAGRGEGSGVAG